MFIWKPAQYDNASSLTVNPGRVCSVSECKSVKCKCVKGYYGSVCGQWRYRGWSVIILSAIWSVLICSHCLLLAGKLRREFKMRTGFSRLKIITCPKFRLKVRTEGRGWRGNPTPCSIGGTEGDPILCRSGAPGEGGVPCSASSHIWKHFHIVQKWEGKKQTPPVFFIPLQFGRILSCFVSSLGPGLGFGARHEMDNVWLELETWSLRVYGVNFYARILCMRIWKFLKILHILILVVISQRILLSGG